MCTIYFISPLYSSACIGTFGNIIHIKYTIYRAFPYYVELCITTDPVYTCARIYILQLYLPSESRRNIAIAIILCTMLTVCDMSHQVLKHAIFSDSRSQAHTCTLYFNIKNRLAAKCVSAYICRRSKYMLYPVLLHITD